MLTPIEIQSKSFKSGMGYSKADVDGFITMVATDYEALYRENIEIKERLSALTDTVAQYKGIEKSLQKALVLAETTSEETIAAAKTNAATIEQEAVIQAEQIVADARRELEGMKARTVLLTERYESYRAQCKSLARAQLELLDGESYRKMNMANVLTPETPVQPSVSPMPETKAAPLFQNVEKQQAAPKKEVALDEGDEKLPTDPTDDDVVINDISEIFKGNE